jgi:histidyl-tRNA synthetase
MTQENVLTTLPGTRDLLPDEIHRWHHVEGRARYLFERYGFAEIRTPLLEPTELFARSIGTDTDIVGKEMYTFEDQSGRSVTLRPEATASVVRSYVQHTMYRAAGVTKLYYIGPMFRHEKKQRGRWRQFFQIGAEVLGSDHPAIEAEVIEMVQAFLGGLGIESRLLVNSVGCPNCRPAYVGKLREVLVRDHEGLCEDCRRRTQTNPLRVLDCKVESCQAQIESLPKITDHLCEVCGDHFRRFRGYLDASAIEYEVVPRLVRGLDYYVRTAFELVSAGLGAQNALAGGGRYDGLAEAIGGPPVQGVGFAMGLDRLVMILPVEAGSERMPQPHVYVAFVGDEGLVRARAVARALRGQGFSCALDYSATSLKSQMRLANRLKARHVLIIGEDEIRSERYVVKRMADSCQWVSSLSELEQYLAGEQAATAR